MKKHFYRFKILLWFAIVLYQDGYSQAVIYSSPNPKNDDQFTEADMLKIDLAKIFRLANADLTGGILANASGGKVTINIYAYNKNAENGKGGLLYRCFSTQNSISYQESYDNISKTEWAVTWDDGGIIMPLTDTWKSTDITKSALTAGLLYWHNGQIYFPVMRQKIPVIVEMTTLSVSASKIAKVKIPALGECNVAVLFPNMPLTPINNKVLLGSHRGNWQDALAPENTQNAIRDMIAENYDMVELDLWNTSDDSVIVFHDLGLNKRTIETGSVQARTWTSISNLYIKNRFDELIQSPNTKIELLRSILDYIKSNDPGGKILLNLDRSANDMTMFKLAYKVVAEKGMLDRAVFKGRFEPDPTKTGGPTAANIRQAFIDMFPSLTPTQRDARMKRMRFTPILFDNKKDTITTNDSAFAQKVKDYIDEMVTAGIADGFELNYKSYPYGSPAFANENDNNVFLLKSWTVLGNKNFVEYVHGKNLPVGIFASAPEVCAVPDFNTDGSRDVNTLVSGFVKEDIVGSSPTYIPYIKEQGKFDFRGDWDFYIPAGADYVITDRPDALRAYLKAIGRFY